MRTLKIMGISIVAGFVTYYAVLKLWTWILYIVGVKSITLAGYILLQILAIIPGINMFALATKALDENLPLPTEDTINTIEKDHFITRVYSDRIEIINKMTGEIHSHKIAIKELEIKQVK